LLEEFAIEIPDEEADRITTVGEGKLDTLCSNESLSNSFGVATPKTDPTLC